MPAVLIEDVHKSYGKLEVLKGVSLSVETGQVVALIGRSGSNDICILHGSVSKLHARAVQKPDGSWRLSDAGSSNGTLVQGVALGDKEERALAPGMLVVIGACHFTVVDAARFHDILLRIDPDR